MIRFSHYLCASVTDNHSKCVVLIWRSMTGCISYEPTSELSIRNFNNKEKLKDDFAINKFYRIFPWHIYCIFALINFGVVEFEKKEKNNKQD